MAILINDNYSLTAPKPFDARYMNISTPWTDCAAAIAGIPTYRYIGLTVNIAGVEYWWKDGVADGDLIPKVLGGASNLSGATNGLQLLCSGTYIGLGGTLSQDTTICGAHTLKFGNSVSGLTALCSVTPEFYVGNGAISGTSICFQHDQNTPHFDVCLYANNVDSCAGMILDVDVNEGFFNAYTAPNSTCCSSICLQTTDSNEAIFDVHSRNAGMKYCKESWISSSCRMTCEVLNDAATPALNIKSVMDYSGRSFNYIIDDSPIVSILSGGTARYASCVTLANDCDLAYKGYVDDTFNSFTVNNGLTKDGSNVRLGGSLTGSTEITIGTNVLDIYGSNAGFTPSFQLDGTQNAVNLIGGEAVFRLQGNSVILKPKATGSDCLSMALSYTTFESTGGTGIRYAGDYESTFVDRSLITKKYVTSVTSGITGAFTTANNGLCANGQIVSLGGALTGSTSITGGGNKNMSFTTLSGFSTCSVTNLACASTSMLLRTPSFTVHNGIGNVITINATCNIFTDAANSRGFVYANNYCVAGKTNPRWIPDAQYVTGLTSQALQTANNGLTKAGQNVRLGGTLTGNTCISGAGLYSLCLRNSGATTCTVGEFSPTTISLCARNVVAPNQTGRVTVSTSAALMCHGYTSCYSCLNMGNDVVGILFCGTTGSFTVTDGSTTKRGIEYAGNYNSTFSNCSLITKEYVTSQVSGITGAITTASNGLTKVGQQVKLGGTLTGATDISGYVDFSMGAITPLFTYYVNAESDLLLCISDHSAQMYLYSGFATLEGGQCVNIIGDNIRISQSGSTPTTQILLTGSTVDIIGTVQLQTTPAVGSTSDDILVRNATTGELKRVSGGAILSSAITGATNGLTKYDSNNVCLGGTITSDITLTGNGNSVRRVWYNKLCSFVVNASDTGNTINSSFAVSRTSCDITMSVEKTATSNCVWEFLDLNFNRIEFGACCSGVLAKVRMCNCGLNYCQDYSSLNTTNPRWIPDAQWVTGKTAGVAVTAGNGLTKLGDNRIVLGGTLTGDTCISQGNQVLVISGDSYAGLIVDANAQCVKMYGNPYIESCIAITSGQADLIECNAGYCSRITQAPTINEIITYEVGTSCSCIITGPNNLKLTARNDAGTACNSVFLDVSNVTLCSTSGFVYLSSLSGTCVNGGLKLQTTPTSGSPLTDALLVWNSGDKIVKQIPASGIVPTAANGLSVNGANIVLGGTLTGDTCIDTGTNAYSLLLSTDVPQSSGCDASIYLSGNNPDSPLVTLHSRNISGCGFAGYMTFSGGTIRVGKTGGAFPGIEYCANYNSNFNNCSLVTKEYVDTEISGISLNTVLVCNVAANYTATTINDFIGVSGATQIWLPSSPKAGQRLIVSDICGNALASNICIIGNGMCINGSGTATINTDYGAMTFINNGHSWSAVAFIN